MLGKRPMPKMPTNKRHSRGGLRTKAKAQLQPPISQPNDPNDPANSPMIQSSMPMLPPDGSGTY